VFEGGGTADLVNRDVPERPEAYPESTMFGVLPAYGFYCRHVKGITFRNIELRATKRDQRHAILCDDVGDLVIDGLDADVGSEAPMRFVDVVGAELRGLAIPEPMDTLLRVEGAKSTGIVLVGGKPGRVGSLIDTAPDVPETSEAPLSPQDKKRLLTLARRMLETYIKTGKKAAPEDLDVEITPGMRQTMGAFVTLTLNGQLRGCIGEIFPRRPLYEAVMERAIDAGVNDPRFRPVTEKELPLLGYEISALTPPVPVNSYQDIVIGKHGMVIQKNGYSAVFLPQVAPEQHWTLEETLTHLSLKAGLPADGWKEGASWTVFEAIVFSDHD